MLMSSRRTAEKGTVWGSGHMTLKNADDRRVAHCQAFKGSGQAIAVVKQKSWKQSGPVAPRKNRAAGQASELLKESNSMLTH